MIHLTGALYSKNILCQVQCSIKEKQYAKEIYNKFIEIEEVIIYNRSIFRQSPA